MKAENARMNELLDHFFESLHLVITGMDQHRQEHDCERLASGTDSRLQLGLELRQSGHSKCLLSEF